MKGKDYSVIKANKFRVPGSGCRVPGARPAWPRTHGRIGRFMFRRAGAQCSVPGAQVPSSRLTWPRAHTPFCR